MRELSVQLKENSYKVIIKNGIINHIGSYVKKIYNNKKIAVVTDENLHNYYGEKMISSLVKEGYELKEIVLEPGEKTKSIENAIFLYEELLDFNISRGDMIISFGGGVIGDLTGFVASTLLRGIPYVQVPTSLLAQVDSSIGGKVAVDLKEGKNLVGSFYHPKIVLIDTDLLRTLPDKYLYDGMGEVIKYGCIKDKELFEKLEKIKGKEDLLENIEDIIYKCCNIKREIVGRDEKDTGERMVLNFGHTFAHAIEKYFNFEKYSHGEAVSIGMYKVTVISEKLGNTKIGTSKRIKDILIKYNLPYEAKIDNNEEILKSIFLDKKFFGEFINIIIIKDIGEVFIDKISKENLNNFIEI